MTTPSSNTAVGPVLKTPQQLVHIKHRISLFQYKLWVLMLRAYREAYEETGEVGEQFCYLSMDRLTEFFGYRPSKADLTDDLIALRSETIIYNVMEKDKGVAQIGQGFISVFYVSTQRIGVIFPPALRKAVEQLDDRGSIFHMLNWSIFNSFTGKYEAIIYKLCKDFVGIGRTKYQSLSEFRGYMGIPDDEYQDFKRLNQWVITGPIKRINESEIADITIQAEFRRENRKVVGLWFHVIPKNRSLLDFGSDPAFRFAKVTIAFAQQRVYLDTYGADQIEACIQRANEYGQSQEAMGTAVDYGAVYRRAIVDNWGKNLQERNLLEQEAAQQAAEKTLADSVQEQHKNLEEQEIKYRDHLVREEINRLTPEQRHQHAMAWLKTPKGLGQESDYDEATSSFKSAINKVNFGRVYIRSVVKPVFSQEAFENWVQESKAHQA